MCGIAGATSLARQAIPALDRALTAMSKSLAHRGPDGQGFWRAQGEVCGFAHRRLAIIDLSPSGRAAHGRSERRCGYVQWRDLQLSRVDGRAAVRLDVPLQLRHRDDPGGLCQVGESIVSSSCAACLRSRLWDGKRLFRSARPLRHQAVLLCGGRRRPLLRVRDQGVAAVSCRRSRPIRTRSPNT